MIEKQRKPEVASSMAMALAMDAGDSGLGPEAFVKLGIQPKSVRTYIADVAQTLIAPEPSN